MPETLRATFDFLRDIASHNDKAWFDQNRTRYANARANFEAFVTELILGVGEFDDMAGVLAKDCMYRLNRDIRFSPDKSPYKTNFGVVIGQGGRKATGRSYYLQLQPDGQSFLAGGLYAPSSQQLEKVRRRIAANPQSFKRVIQAAAFTRYFGQLHGAALKTAPQGYAKDHPAIELLRLKQYMAIHPLRDDQVLAPNASTQVVTVFKAMQPFVAYLDEAVNG